MKELLNVNGESGIRTHGDLSATRLFESRTIDHSDISPWRGLLFNPRLDTLGGNRTPDALLRTEALYPLSYKGPLCLKTALVNQDCEITEFISIRKIRSEGLEPPAYRSATCRSIR